MNSHHDFELSMAVSAVDHVLGAAHAPVTVVEEGDFGVGSALFLGEGGLYALVWHEPSQCDEYVECQRDPT